MLRDIVNAELHHRSVKFEGTIDNDHLLDCYDLNGEILEILFGL